MPNSEPCDRAAWGLDSLAAGRLRHVARSLGEAHAQQAGEHDVESASRDFASLFYGILVQQMRRTASADEEGDDDDEEEGQSVVAQGAWDFFNMYLPGAIARQADDPLTTYIRQRMEEEGDGSDTTPR